MKKLFFFLTAFALLAANAVAQPESMFGGRTVSMTGKVVRAWDAGGGIISYYENSLGEGTVGLILSTSGTTINEFSLPTGYHVADLRVVGNDVYMCGRLSDASGSQGIVMRFDANELATAVPVSLDVQTFTASDVSRLDRMAAYELSPGYFKVVAIGSYEEIIYPYLNGMDVAVECDYRGGTCTSAQFVTVGNRVTLEIYEHLHDVVVTDNYVAIVGNVTNILVLGVGDNISLRVGDKANVLQTMFVARPAYYYVPSGDVPISVNIATAMDGDKIATACLSHDMGSPDKFRIQMRYFDLASRMMTNTQWTRIGLKVAPSELVFVPADNSVVMLGELDFPSAGDDECTFLFLEPLKTVPYTAYGMYRHGEPFMSATCFRNHYVTGLSRARWLLKDKLMPLANNCYKFGKRNMEVDNIVGSYKVTYPYSMNPAPPSILLRESVSVVPLRLNCVH